jgi:FkbM family methyltransferase
MLKKILKSFFSSLGYEIKNKNYKDIFTVRLTMEEALDQLKNVGFYPDLVIDAGAADGTPPLQLCFSDAVFFWVEPLEEFKDSLEALKRKYKGEYIIAALGRHVGEMDLNVSDDKVGSSILNSSEPPGGSAKTRRIKTETLAHLNQTRNFSQYKKILLKVDVQGYELHVLEGAGDFLHNIEVVILEVSFYNFLNNCPDFYDVVSFMKSKGFVVYDIVGGINRPFDMALGQKDLVFVKEAGAIRNSHKWD